MLVVFKQDIDKVGRMGETKNVAPGFANNFLLPKGLAVPASQKDLVLEIRQKKSVKKRKVESGVKPAVKITHKQRRLKKQELKDKKAIIGGKNGFGF